MAAALAAATGGPVPEGNVGGGTGMICHDFKGGIGTASRVADCGGETFTVGALVQANHGRRERFQVNGVPVGLLLGDDVVPIPVTPEEERAAGGRAAPTAPARSSSSWPPTRRSCPRSSSASPSGPGSASPCSAPAADNYSGDLMLAFSTANRGLTSMDYGETGPLSFPVEMLSLAHIDPLFEAAVEATEEAILNAMLRPRR